MPTVEIIDTTARDGLQNEDTVLSTVDKLDLIHRVVRAGARRLEVTSLVNPLRVPQMADADEVLAEVRALDGVSMAGLVMNQRGLERALRGGVDEVNIVVVATDTFCARNQGMATFESCDSAAALVAEAQAAGVFATVTIGAAFGCPFEGEVPGERLRQVLGRVADAGPDELAMADTIGVAVPSDVRERVALARSVAGDEAVLRLHLHDTRHTGVANAVAAYEAGVSVLDATVGGSGGCPFAPNATGNVALEDLLYLFSRMGVETNYDPVVITETVTWLEGRLGRRLPGALARAGGFPLPSSAEANTP